MRRVVEPSTYNGTDKVNLKAPTYTSKEQVGRDPVEISKSVKKPLLQDVHVPKDNQRFLHEVAGHRDIFNKKVYVGIKGQSKIPVQKQTESSDPDIIRWNKTTSDFNPEEKHKPAKSIVNDERDHHRLYSTHGAAKTDFNKPNNVHRTSYAGHPATRSNFNIFGY